MGDEPKGRPVPVEIPAKKHEHRNIHEALSAFQGELKTMPRSAKVEFSTQKGKVEFNYTPLGEIMTYIYPLLAKHGLAVRHEISDAGVEAILTHSSYKQGQPIFATTDIATGNIAEPGTVRMVKDFQKFETPSENELRSGVVKLRGGGDQMKDTGAAITYARRYTLTMLLGISSEDDKDAELLEASAKNAQNFAEGRARKGIEEAKTIAELEKATNVLKKDLKLVETGKPGALGLSKETYEELLEMAQKRSEDITGEPHLNL